MKNKIIKTKQVDVYMKKAVSLSIVQSMVKQAAYVQQYS